MYLQIETSTRRDRGALIAWVGGAWVGDLSPLAFARRLARAYARERCASVRIVDRDTGKIVLRIRVPVRVP